MKEKKNYAMIRTTRARYDRVSYVRVLKDLDRGIKSNGFLVTYPKVGKKNEVKIVTEFIPDKWIVEMRMYAS